MAKKKKKNALVFYSRLPIEGVASKTRIGKEINNLKLSSALGRAMINDMLTEFNPFVEDNYDLIYFYVGDRKSFRTQYKYNINRFVEDRTGGYVGAGMLFIHSLIAADYENIVIAGSDIPLLSKSMIKSVFKELDGNSDSVIVPVEDGGYGLLGMHGFTDLYSDIKNWSSRTSGYDLSNETIKLAEKKGLSLNVFPTLWDLDLLEDIKRLYNTLAPQNDRLNYKFAYLTRTFEFLKKNKEAFKL